MKKLQAKQVANGMKFLLGRIDDNWMVLSTNKNMFENLKEHFQAGDILQVIKKPYTDDGIRFIDFMKNGVVYSTWWSTFKTCTLPIDTGIKPNIVDNSPIIDFTYNIDKIEVKHWPTLGQCSLKINFKFKNPNKKRLNTKTLNYFKKQTEFADFLQTECKKALDENYQDISNIQSEQQNTLQTNFVYTRIIGNSLEVDLTITKFYDKNFLEEQLKEGINDFIIDKVSFTNHEFK